MTKNYRFISYFLILAAFVLQANSALAGAGDLDTTFGTNGKVRGGFKRGNDEVNAMVTQADGKLIAVGTTPNGDPDFLVARYNTDGSLDTSFGGGKGRVTTHFGSNDDVATAVALQANGKIVVAGYCAGQNMDVCLARYNADGSLDTLFGINGKIVTPVTTSWDYGRGVAIQPDGKIIVVGDSMTNNSSSDMIIIRYTTNGGLDTTFGSSGTGIVVKNVIQNNNDVATGVAVQPDGKILIAGYGSPFSSPEFLVIARLTAAGQTDTTWWLNGTGTFRFTNTGNHRGNAVAIQPDGKVLVAGVADSKFMTVRFTTTGLLDSSFNGTGYVLAPMAPGSGTDEALAMTLDGPTITVGGYSDRNGHKDLVIARYADNGFPAALFNGTGRVVLPLGPGNSQVNAVAIQASGIVGGGSVHNGSNKDLALVRYTPTGSPDMTFDNDGKRIEDPGTRETSGRGMVIQPDGKILVAGYTDTDSTYWDFVVARYNTNGSLDQSFGVEGAATADFGTTQDEGVAVALAPDGKIVVVGSTLEQQTQNYDIAVARFHANGNPDLTFNGTGKLVLPIGLANDWGRGVTVQPDGKIVIVGSTDVPQGNSDVAVVRLTQSGSLDNTFNGTGKAVTAVGLNNDEANSVAILPDGKIVASGVAYNGPSDADFAVVRYTAAGVPDNTFGSFGRQITPIGVAFDIANGLAVQPDGKILLAGYSTNVSGTTAQYAVVRYGTNGQPDSTFDNDGIVTTTIGLTVSVGTDVAVQPDGKIVVGGAVALGSDIGFAAARYLSNGSLDDTYGVGGKAVSAVEANSYDIGWSVAIDGQGRTVMAGDAQKLFGLVRFKGDAITRDTPFDFDGDNKSDVSIFRPSNGEWWVLKSSNGGNFATQFGSGTDRMVPADFTGDGKTDVAFWRPSTGQWFVLRSDDQSFFAFPFGTNGDIPVPADYDGDDKADAAVFRPSNATWFIRRSSDGGTTIQQFGASTDQPVPADYDGDGKADLAIRRPSNGEWWINRSTAGVVAMQFGNGSDKTVVGDYTGDGKADVAFWRPSTGQWFVLRSENQSFFAFPFGTNGDIPSPADYDGDGKTDATVFRPAGATWFVNKTSGGVLTVPFGASGDQPVPNAFVK